MMEIIKHHYAIHPTNWNFLDQLLLPYKSHGNDVPEVHFSIPTYFSIYLQYSLTCEEDIRRYCNTLENLPGHSRGCFYELKHYRLDDLVA